MFLVLYFDLLRSPYLCDAVIFTVLVLSSTTSASLPPTSANYPTPTLLAAFLLTNHCQSKNLPVSPLQNQAYVYVEVKTEQDAVRQTGDAFDAFPLTQSIGNSLVLVQGNLGTAGLLSW
jgi:hypothetical protein